MEEKYQNISDLLDNTSFRNWVFRSVQSDIEYWDKWILDHPEKKSMILEAAGIIRGLTIEAPVIAETEKQMLKQQLMNSMKDSERTQVIPNRSVFSIWLPRVAVAASLLLLVFIGYRLLKESITSSFKEITTNHEETSIIVLPDGSEVILNANSKLRFASQWNSEDIREVWLEGEAFFSVNDSPLVGRQKFWVHNGDVKVEVLGTEFNVRQLAGHSEVVLNSGKVKLLHELTRDSVFLEPGNRAVYSSEERMFVKQDVNTDVYISWTDGKITFDDTPVSEIAQRIEDYYGMHVLVDDSTLNERTLTGSLTLSKLDPLLETLALTFQIDIQKKQDTILLKVRP